MSLQNDQRQQQDRLHGLPSDERLRGVFSSQEVRVIGTGTTQRKMIQKVFWFVDQDDDNTIQVQPLNINYIPSGAKKIVTMDELLEKYAPEPEFYVQSVYPKIREMDESVEMGDRCRDKNELYSAEFEYNNALCLDVENVRANFGIGLTYLARGEVDKAENIFDRLVHLEAAFQEEHKHLFNDFGINLRKSKMYTQAKEYYARALELTTADENLHINMARALLELGEYLPCTQHLLDALQLAPDSDMAKRFLVWLDERNLIPPERRQEIKRYLNNDPEPDAPALPLASSQHAAADEGMDDLAPDAPNTEEPAPIDSSDMSDLFTSKETTPS
ncbi:MAG: hypothetical protein RR317_06625 [Bilophila sp.]